METTDIPPQNTQAQQTKSLPARIAAVEVVGHLVKFKICLILAISGFLVLPMLYIISFSIMAAGFIILASFCSYELWRVASEIKRLTAAYTLNKDELRFKL